MSTGAGSTSANPDLGWSQLNETIVMLNLAIAQIKQSLIEGNASVDTLATSFTGLATDLKEIEHLSTQINTTEHSGNEELQAIIQSYASTAYDRVQSAIIAFQFYDKLTQRLEHVSQSLDSLSQLLADPKTVYTPTQWLDLQHSIRSKYTMEEERRMFDKVMAGLPIAEALAELNKELQDTDHSDDVELF